ncbi:EAL domain-containing protein [Oxalobacteraceae bacterium]|nr:EAL domain-containing protein [Oxalobacteraceae bacterium]
MSEASVAERDDEAGATPIWQASSNGGASRQALELIAQIVEAIELTPIVAVRSFDRSGRVRFWNQSCCQLYEITTEEALGQPLTALLQPADSADEHAVAVEQVWQTGKPSPARDWQVRTRSGRLLWIYSSMFPVYRGGTLHQVFCMDIDVTARKQEETALQSVSVNFRQLFHKSSDAILLIRDERIADLNPAALALFDCAGAQQQMLGRTLIELSPLRQNGGGLSAEAMPAALEQAHAQDNWRFDWRFVSAQGRLFWTEVLLTSVKIDHEKLFYAIIRDISARKNAEQRLFLAAQVFENSRDAILLTDREQTIIAVNQAYAEVTGHPASEIVGQPLARHRAGIEDAVRFAHLWQELLANGHWQGEITALRRDGVRYPGWMSLTAIRDGSGETCNYMAILSDISERKRSEENTRHLAEHDFLTDLPNRVLLLDRLSLALTAARRKQTMLAVMFLDLDRFKNINDTLGHHIGDLLLKEVALRLVKCVRGADTVSRQGGDEFVLLLSDIGGIDQAAHVATSILSAIAQVYLLEQHQLHVSTSIGISIYPDDGQDIDTLVRNADLAMYHAKESGRNCFQFFNADMNERIVERVAFENALRGALAEQQFKLVFQHEIDIASGQAVAAEALIRWCHPQLGELAPDRFLDVAEQCGLMIPIGNWVLQQACQQARRWQQQGTPLVVAVNLSLAQLGHRHLIASVRTALDMAELAPQWLELEVTETSIMQLGHGALETLRALRALGVCLTIDDFGTGYTRLSQLKDYPLNKLKIDCSFTAGIDSEPRHASVIGTIIGMAHSLHLRVVAEGVETAGQLEFLREQGCDQYQGYYAAAPSPVPALPNGDGAAGLA